MSLAKHWIVILLLLSFFLLPMKGRAQCDTIHLGIDTTLCEGLSVQLDVGPGFTSYLWNDESVDQFLVVDEPGSYWCEVEFLDSANLVVNGDFSAGNAEVYRIKGTLSVLGT